VCFERRKQTISDRAMMVYAKTSTSRPGEPTPPLLRILLEIASFRSQWHGTVKHWNNGRGLDRKVQNLSNRGPRADVRVPLTSATKTIPNGDDPSPLARPFLDTPESPGYAAAPPS
jgi:hypothetical protein